MFLSKVELSNWRRFSKKSDEEPGLTVEFSKGLNVLVGENDSGKTAIIDAIKVSLGTNSSDSIWITEEDFSIGSKNLRIDLYFSGLSEKEEEYFFEWLTLPIESQSELHLCLEAEQYEDVNGKLRIKKLLKAGPSGAEVAIDEAVRYLLSITYLKPLRDAHTELSAGNKSRISQVIQGLKEFSGDNNPEKKAIVKKFQVAFDELQKKFDEPVLQKIKKATQEFFETNSNKQPSIGNKEMPFSEILKKLNLTFEEVGTGLGSSNLLFMALELILFDQDEVGLNLALVEEIEAHIHPQAQLRVIKFFEHESQNNDKDVQYIFTTHSPILAASLPLDSIIMIYEGSTYSMGSGKTKLDQDDYAFLERFLDATKSNLFFAKGVIMVEGDAENILLPTFAEVIGKPLYKYGVSIVNVGSLAIKRYSSIFLRSVNRQLMNFPVAILTDLDFKDYVLVDGKNEQELADKLSHKKEYFFDGIENTKVYISQPWTFEHSLLNSCLREGIEEAILAVNYTLLSHVDEKKKEWGDIEDGTERATATYKFMIDRKISKSIVAQKLAQYIKNNKAVLSSKIKEDPQLKYLIEMIDHVTQNGGDSFGV